MHRWSSFTVNGALQVLCMYVCMYVCMYMYVCTYVYVLSCLYNLYYAQR